MAKVLRCEDVRAGECREVFRGETELAVLALILEHWSAVHQTHTTTSTLVGRMRSAIRDE
jgi:hypothetical protein